MELSRPFNPIEQLMAVLPSDSAHAIPEAARWLMSDPESPILDFYPKNVPVDPNGKAMPWLWVVLLPFIDEDRLLGAMMPTMAKWTKEELLCNAQGLDDGYLYVHKSNPLTKKLSQVLAKGKSAKDPKIRLTNTAAYGATGFSGSVRAPLTNEFYHMDEDNDEPVVVKLPPTASKIEQPGPDGLFTEDLDGNLAACVAFSEPSKLPHKSVLLPGARPLPSILTEDDKRIRRPRLGRGGSIANMGGGGGGGTGQSHQAGYGSMNIGSYERDLAARTGRGKELYQAGTRLWGAMEPTPKQPPRGRPQQHIPPPPPPPLPGNRIQPPPNPFLTQQRNQQPQYHHHHQQIGNSNPQSWQSQQQQPRWQPSQQPPPHRPQQQQQQYAQANNNYNNSNQSMYKNNNDYQQWQHGGGGLQQRQQQQQWQPQAPGGYSNNTGGYNSHGLNHNNARQYNDNNVGTNRQAGSRPYPNRPPPQPPQPLNQGQQGFSFRTQMHGATPTTRRHHYHQEDHQRSRASADAMHNLRAQLSNTLSRQNHHQGNNPNYK